MQARCLVLCMLGMATFLTSLVAAPGSDTKWRIGEPIVTYWAGPGSHSELNDTTAAQLAAGGWNLGWADKPEHLDIYYRHGMRAMLSVGWRNSDPNDPAQAQAIDEKIAQVRDHPALYAYYLTDEPGAAAFPKLGKVVAYVRERDPAHVAYINLYPIYANNEQLGTEGDTVTAYREHLRQFVDIVKPDLLSYCHYPFKKRGDLLTYFLNLMLVRDAALKAGIPFVNVTQAIAHEAHEWRWPTEHEERWLAYTTLAYGGQGICWYIYNYHIWSGFFKDGLKSEVPKPEYWAISRTNRDFAAIATELQPLKSLAAYHVGEHAKGGSPDDETWKKLSAYQVGTLPLGGVALPANSRFKVDSPASQTNFLLGCFGKSGSNLSSHVLLVNLDYKQPVTALLVGPGPMEVFHAPTRTWTPSSTGSRARLNLPPGGGTLVRLVKQT